MNGLMVTAPNWVLLCVCMGYLCAGFWTGALLARPKPLRKWAVIAVVLLLFVAMFGLPAWLIGVPATDLLPGAR